MTRKVLVVTALLAGLVLIVLGATWKYWHSPQSLWSKEQATEHSAAWRNLKITATSGVRRGDAATDPKLAAAQARFDKINSELEHAKTMHSYAGLIFIAVGIIVVAISAWTLLPQATPET
jgi:hypothetical protein